MVIGGGILYIHINKSGLSTKIFFQNKGQKSKEIRVDILMYCIVGISKRFRQAWNNIHQIGGYGLNEDILECILS